MLVLIKSESVPITSNYPSKTVETTLKKINNFSLKFELGFLIRKKRVLNNNSNSMKEILKPNEAIIILDYAENYSFVV